MSQTNYLQLHNTSQGHHLTIRQEYFKNINTSESNETNDETSDIITRYRTGAMVKLTILLFTESFTSNGLKVAPLI